MAPYGSMRCNGYPSSWICDWSRAEPPGNPIHICADAHAVDAKGRLIICGQRIFKGFAIPFHGSNSLFLLPGSIIDVSHGQVRLWGNECCERDWESIVLVQVSEDNGLLLRELLGSLFAILSEFEIIRKCRLHDNDSQCESECSSRRTILGSIEQFPIH